MRVGLAYGRGKIEVELPDAHPIDVLEKRALPPLPDAHAALLQALDAALGTPPLSELARGRRSAAIVVSDLTRPTPNALLLGPMLDALRRGGMPPEAVSVVVATGLHRPCTPAELDELLGSELARTLRIHQHDARDAASHVDLGRTQQGIPIRIDRHFCEQELRIVTGLVEPHLMAGYSGGRKAVCPGLAATESIRVAHGPSLLEAQVGPGIVEGNPLHASLIEIVRKVGVHFSVQVVLDGQRRIAGLFCGDVEASHDEAMRCSEQESEVSVEASPDLVVVSGGGYPLDQTFYQSVKGISTAANIVRPGGAILLCASLAQGIGSPSFEKCLRESGGPEDFELKLEDDQFFEIDQWMVQHLCQARRRARVWLYSDGLPPEVQRELFVEPAASPEHGIAQALEALGTSGTPARVAVIPQGPYVLATVRGEKRPLGGKPHAHT